MTDTSPVKETPSPNETIIWGSEAFLTKALNRKNNEYFPGRSALSHLAKADSSLQERSSEDLHHLETKLRKSSGDSLVFGMLGENESLPDLLKTDEQQLAERFPGVTPQILAERLAVLLTLTDYTRDAKKSPSPYKTAYLPDDAPASLGEKNLPVDQLKTLLESTGMLPEEIQSTLESYIHRPTFPGYAYDHLKEQSFVLPSGTRLLVRVAVSRGTQGCPLEHNCDCAGSAMIQILNLSNGKQVQTGDLIVHFAAMGFFEGKGVPEFRVDPVELAEVLDFEHTPTLEPVTFREIKGESLDSQFEGYQMPHDLSVKLREKGRLNGRRNAISTWVSFGEQEVTNPPGSLTQTSYVDDENHPPREIFSQIFGSPDDFPEGDSPIPNPNLALASLDNLPFNQHGYRYTIHEGVLLLEIGEKNLDPKELAKALKEEGLDVQIGPFGQIKAKNIGIFSLKKRNGFIPQITQDATSAIVLK